MNEVKIIRTLHNQLIIGKVVQDKFTKLDYIVVQEPYNVVPGQDGIELYPMDKEIVQADIEEIELYKSNLIYSTKPGQDLANTYLKAISGIETEPEKTLILG